jgi:hypothetical protein
MQNQPINNPCSDMHNWKEIIDDWSKSGESQKKYCDRLELNLNKFTYERSKLLSENKIKNPFVRLAVKNEVGNFTNSSTIILENSRGLKLYLPTNLSLDQFANLFKISGWLDA